MAATKATNKTAKPATVKPDIKIIKAKKEKADTITVDSSKKVKRGTMHPRYREVNIIQTDGTTFVTRSTYKNDSIKLDIDIKTHPAWTREAGYVNTKSSEVAKFNNKFAGLTFGLKK